MLYRQNSLYTLALRQTASIQADITALEQSYLTSAPSANSGLNGQITASLAALDRTVEDYDSMARREIVEAKKEKALARVARFREDYASLRKHYNEVKTNGASAKAAADREALLSSSSSAVSASFSQGGPSSRAHRGAPTSPVAESPFTINMNGTGPPPPGGGYRPNSPFDDGGFAASIHNNPRTNHALRESDFMASTSATLETYIQQGQAVLGNLATQKDILKGTRRRLLNAANTLGLSRTTIQYIERRTKADWYILMGGGAFTLFCFYLILKYFG
ncbi:golgi SNAP receptor complex member 2 [Pseudohyphozyma bogoriensis]|nr:golgi SNAP receptor complex member 2 [Pseudohyphozyma bogoriensis]